VIATAQTSNSREENVMPAELFIKKPVQSVGTAALGLERHYSVGEIAEIWGLSEKIISRMFEGEEGVLKWGSPETRRKRGSITLRIPERVMLRVHRKRTQRAS
jgi:hypothetical protein